MKSFYKYFFIFTFCCFWFSSIIKISQTIQLTALIYISFIYTNFAIINAILKRCYCFILLKIIFIYIYIFLYTKSLCLIFSSHFLISSISVLISLFLSPFEKVLQLILFLLYLPLALKPVELDLTFFVVLELFLLVFSLVFNCFCLFFKIFY